MKDDADPFKEIHMMEREWEDDLLDSFIFAEHHDNKGQCNGKGLTIKCEIPFGTVPEISVTGMGSAMVRKHDQRLYGC